MTLRVTEVRPFRFHRAPHTPPRSRGGGGPGRRGARNGSWGAGVTPYPAPELPESGAPNPAPPRARPRAGSRLPAAARRITPLAAARLVPGRSPDAHWPGRRSQAVSSMWRVRTGMAAVKCAGAGLEGARETVAASPPPRAPSSLSFSRSQSCPRPYQVQRPGRAGAGSCELGTRSWGQTGSGAGAEQGGRARGAPPARILWPWVRMVRR